MILEIRFLVLSMKYLLFIKGLLQKCITIMGELTNIKSFVNIKNYGECIAIVKIDSTI